MRDIVKFLDRTLGKLLCVLLFLFKPLKKKRDTPKKILAILFWGIGSNIVTLPALKQIKESYPKARLHVLMPKSNTPLAYGKRYIDKVMGINMSLFGVIRFILKNIQEYDLVFDFEHWMSISAIIGFVTGKKQFGFSNTFRSILYDKKVKFDAGKHALINNINMVALTGRKTTIPKYPEEIEIGGKDKGLTERFMRNSKLKAKRYIIIAPAGGPTVPQRIWPKERYIELVSKLARKYDHKIVFIAGPDEKEYVEDIKNRLDVESINAAGLNIAQTAYLIKNAALFIGNDGGPLHISAAQKMPTIGLFGPETPVIFGPYGPKDNNIGLYKGGKYSPSIRVYEGKYANCDKDDSVKNIKVNDVMDAVKNIFG